MQDEWTYIIPTLKSNILILEDAIKNKDMEITKLEETAKESLIVITELNRRLEELKKTKDDYIEKLLSRINDLKNTVDKDQFIEKQGIQEIIKNKDQQIENLINRNKQIKENIKKYALNYNQNVINIRNLEIRELNKRYEELKKSKDDKIAELRAVIQKQAFLVQTMKELAVTIGNAKICE